MYQTIGNTWVALGDPIGPEEGRRELVWMFRDLCDTHDGMCVFYEVSKGILPLILDIGLVPIKIGEEAIVDLATFSIHGTKGRGFRSTLNRMEREGYEFFIIPKDEFDQNFDVLKEVSESWLREKTAREKGFSLGFFDRSYLRNFSTAAVRK